MKSIKNKATENHTTTGDNLVAACGLYCADGMLILVKHYIGKGKQVEGLSIAKCTCKLADLEKFSYEYDGVQYVTFECAKMKSPDNFGRDYTLYVSKKEETEGESTSKKAAKKAV